MHEAGKPPDSVTYLQLLRQETKAVPRQETIALHKRGYSFPAEGGWLN